MEWIPGAHPSRSIVRHDPLLYNQPIALSNALSASSEAVEISSNFTVHGVGLYTQDQLRFRGIGRSASSSKEFVMGREEPRRVDNS